MQDLIVYTDGSVTKDQSGWSFMSSKVQLPSMKTVQPQPPAWQWRWKQSPMLDCLKRWQSDHPCHHLHRFNELATKWKVEWEAQTGMCRWSTSTFEISCGCTALDMPEWRETTEQVDWQAKQPSQVACFSKILSVEKHETLPVGTKPRTSHHWSPGGERHWKKKC